MDIENFGDSLVSLVEKSLKVLDNHKKHIEELISKNASLQHQIDILTLSIENIMNILIEKEKR